MRTKPPAPKAVTLARATPPTVARVRMAKAATQGMTVLRTVSS
jgi:hypothetical protein